MNKKFYGILAAICAFGVLVPFIAYAQAQQDNHVSVPWGQVVASLVLSAGAVASGLVAFVKNYLPAPARWALELTKIDQILNRAIQAAAFDLSEKIKSEGFTVEVKNDMLRQAIQVAINNGSNLVNAQLPNLEAKVKARIQDYINSKVHA